ncbi:MAG: ATP-binding cassette domain-containing protein [Pseudomonadota bacterium]
MKTVLSCEKLVRTYTEAKLATPVLRGVDLEVAENDSIAIIGSSGCGKSTLLHLLGGLDKPTSGKVCWHNQDVNTLSEKQKCVTRNRKIGFIYQFHHLLPEFSAWENVALPLLIGGEKPAKAQAAACKLLAAVGLSQRVHHKIGQLSGGERQRTAVARALVAQPNCILADEPTGNLDRQTARQVLELMLDLQRQFKTSFIIVTHDPDIAANLNKTYHLLDGVLHAD